MATVNKSFFRKSAAFLAGLILLAACLEGSLRLLGSRYAARLPLAGKSPAYTVLCVGDSFTYGAGAPEESSYPRQLATVLKERFPGRAFRVINFGESAQNTAQLLNRLPQALGETRPDAVVLLSGMSNFWNYWGYRDGTTPSHRNILDRLRTARLTKLLWREVVRRFRERSAAKKKELRLRCSNNPEHGLCLEKTREFRDIEGILAVCKTAARKCPQDTDALKSIGFTYLNTSRPAEALEWLKMAAEKDPDDPFVYIGISNALGNNRSEAEKWMRLGALRTGGATKNLYSGKYDIPAWIRLDLNEAIDLAAASGAKLILQNYPGNEREESLITSGILRETASARALPFVDQASVFTRLTAGGRRDDYFAHRDPHCSARGYRVMAEQVAGMLEEAGFLKRGVQR